MDDEPGDEKAAAVALAASVEADPATPKKATVAGGTGAGEAPSTVKRFISANGGAGKALKRYIASFADDSTGTTELGQQPPCRSYRSLRLLDELGREIEGKLNAVRYKDWAKY